MRLSTGFEQSFPKDINGFITLLRFGLSAVSKTDWRTSFGDNVTTLQSPGIPQASATFLLIKCLSLLNLVSENGEETWSLCT